METIMFKRTYLTSYRIITEPGKYALQVSNDVSEKNLVTNEDGTFPRYIAGLKAIAVDKLPQLKAAFGDADEVPIEQLNGVFMSANIPANEYTILPAKGELIDTVVDYVMNAEKSGQVLRAISTKVRKAKTAPVFDVVKFFEATEATTAKAGTTLQHS